MTNEAKDVKTFSGPRWDYIYKWEELLDTQNSSLMVAPWTVYNGGGASALAQAVAGQNKVRLQLTSHITTWSEQGNCLNEKKLIEMTGWTG